MASFISNCFCKNKQEIPTNICLSQKCFTVLCPSCINIHILKHKECQQPFSIQSLKAFQTSDNMSGPVEKLLQKQTETMLNKVKDIQGNMKQLWEKCIVQLTIEIQKNTLLHRVKDRFSRNKPTLGQVKHGRNSQMLDIFLREDNQFQNYKYILNALNKETIKWMEKLYTVFGNSESELRKAQEREGYQPIQFVSHSAPQSDLKIKRRKKYARMRWTARKYGRKRLDQIDSDDDENGNDCEEKSDQEMFVEARDPFQHPSSKPQVRIDKQQLKLRERQRLMVTDKQHEERAQLKQQFVGYFQYLICKGILVHKAQGTTSRSLILNYFLGWIGDTGIQRMNVFQNLAYLKAQITHCFKRTNLVIVPYCSNNCYRGVQFSAERMEKALEERHGQSKTNEGDEAHEVKQEDRRLGQRTTESLPIKNNK